VAVERLFQNWLAKQITVDKTLQKVTTNHPKCNAKSQITVVISLRLKKTFFFHRFKSIFRTFLNSFNSFAIGQNMNSWMRSWRAANPSIRLQIYCVSKKIAKTKKTWKSSCRTEHQYKQPLQTRPWREKILQLRWRTRFLQKNVFKKKHVAEGQIVTELTDPRCQKQTSKKDFRTSICNGIDGFLKHLFAAQVPGVL